MKKHDKDTMNYDENGYYYSESDDNSAPSGLAAIFVKAMGYIMLLWFFATIILLVVMSRSDRDDKAWLMVILFFQLFAVFGIFGIISDLISKSKFQKALLLPLIIGAGGCIITLLIHNSEGEEREHLLKILATAFPLVFAALGTCSLIGSLRAKYHLKNACTETISAKCVDVSTISTTVNGRTTYKYVHTYEYEYDGEDYTSTAFKTPEQHIVGSNYDILVNPNKPKEIYEPTSVDDSTAGIVLTALFLVILPIGLSVVMAYFLLINP